MDERARVNPIDSHDYSRSCSLDNTGRREMPDRASCQICMYVPEYHQSDRTLSAAAVIVMRERYE